MRTATIIRGPSDVDGTFGTITLEDGVSWVTGELPWRGNQSGISCIPEGSYKCTWFDSPKHGWCYLVNGVPGRNMIEIHSANFMGDKRAGRLTQLQGCIALGKEVGYLDGQKAILKSKKAIEEFESNLQGQSFLLTIISQKEEGK